MILYVMMKELYLCCLNILLLLYFCYLAVIKNFIFILDGRFIFYIDSYSFHYFEVLLLDKFHFI